LPDPIYFSRKTPGTFQSVSQVVSLQPHTASPVFMPPFPAFHEVHCLKCSKCVTWFCFIHGHF